MHVIDTATNTLVASVPLTSLPRDVAITPDGAFAFVTGQFGANEVTVIATATNAVITTIPVGMCPEGIAMTPTLSSATQVMNLILLVESLDFPHGLETSLTSKLEAAVAAINRGKTPRACSRLQAFVHHVGAQAGKKLTVDEATQLIGEANQVSAVLGCEGS